MIRIIWYAGANMWKTKRKKKKQHSRNKDALFDFLAVQYRSSSCSSGVMQRNKWCGSESFYSKLRGKHAVIFDALCRNNSSRAMWASRVRRMHSGEDFPSSWKLLLWVLAGRFTELTVLSDLVDSWHLTTSSSLPQTILCFVIVIWTYLHVLLQQHIKRNVNQRHYHAPRHQPPQGLPSYLAVHGVKHWKNAELFGCGLYQIAIISDAAVCSQRCYGGQDGCVSVASSLLSEKIKLYAWQSVPKWIPVLPAGMSAVRS